MTVPADIATRLARVIERTFDLRAGSVGPEAELGQTPHWDSLGHIELMLAVEAEFGVRLRSDQVGSLRSFGSLREFLEHGQPR